MKLPYSTRPASVDDLQQVAAIEARSIKPPWSQQAFAAELAKPHANFWVITDDETDSEVMAYAVFAMPAEQAHLQTIAVHHDHRRKGLAALLVRRLIAFVAKKGGESVILEVRKSNEAAIKLYQGLGFVVIRALKGFYPDGEDGFAMLYKLEPTRIQPAGDGEDDFDRRKTNLN